MEEIVDKRPDIQQPATLAHVLPTVYTFTYPGIKTHSAYVHHIGHSGIRSNLHYILH